SCKHHLEKRFYVQEMKIIRMLGSTLVPPEYSDANLRWSFSVAPTIKTSIQESQNHRKNISNPGPRLEILGKKHVNSQALESRSTCFDALDLPVKIKYSRTVLFGFKNSNQCVCIDCWLLSRLKCLGIRRRRRSRGGKKLYKPSTTSTSCIQPVTSNCRCSAHLYSKPNGVNYSNLINLQPNANRTSHIVPNKKLNFISSVINARSVCNKTLLIKDLVVDKRIDLLGITETWLHQEGDDSIIGDLCPTEFTSSGLLNMDDDTSLSVLVNNYHTVLCGILDELAPVKTRSIIVHPNALWYNDEIADAKKKRRRLERKWRSNGLDCNRANDLAQCDVVNKMLQRRILLNHHT
ncbi:Hypothetical predicted protein, partial [Paramuricea clavata]